MLRVKQGGIKYHFLNLWYDSTWDWTQVAQTIGKHSNHYTNGLGLYVKVSRTDARLCIYHLFVWSNLNFLHISQWITLPTQSCLFLYFFSANLLHSLIVWLMVSSLSPYNLHLQFCCVLSILAYYCYLVTINSSISNLYHMSLNPFLCRHLYWVSVDIEKQHRHFSVFL